MKDNLLVIYLGILLLHYSCSVTTFAILTFCQRWSAQLFLSMADLWTEENDFYRRRSIVVFETLFKIAEG